MQSTTATATAAALQAKVDLATKGYAIIENVITAAQVATAKQYFKAWLTLIQR